MSVTTTEPQRAAKRIHPLLLALAMASGAVAALGFARFAYALLLPSMKVALHWSYFTAGLLNVINALGYLVGAALTATLARKLGTKRLFLSALGGLSLVVASVGLTSTLWVILILRLLSGILGATIFISGGALVAWATRDVKAHLSTAALGIYYGGAGLGTAISGAFLPLLLGNHGPERWRTGWLLLGVGCLVALGITLLASTHISNPPTQHRSATGRISLVRLWPSMVCYGIFGAGYISFMTFIIAYYRGEGHSEGFVSAFYVTLGLAAFITGLLWNKALARLRRGFGLAATLLPVSAGAIVALISSSLSIAILSALLFGAGFMATSTAFTMIARRNLPASQLTSALGRATVAMAAGQSLGPFFSGIVSDTPRGLTLGLELAALLIVISLGVSLLQRDHSYDSTEIITNSTP